MEPPATSDARSADYRNATWLEHEQISRAVARRYGQAAAALVRAHLEHAAVNVQVVLATTAAAS